MDYLLGPLAFISWVHDFIVPPPILGANHSYLAFIIFSTTLASRATPMLPWVYVHFEHILDHVYVSHLTQTLDLL